ncbi:MAG: hypothetical protein H6711_06650 [Myxococcales bacterium]|nr:hypothetical protein [Myxococcales bacterium]
MQPDPEHCRYLDQECPLTLAEGLEEFAAANPGLIPSDESTELGRLTRAHDACHVLFGLTTAVEDEALADTWTLAASTVTLREYMQYLKHEEFTDLIKQIGAWPMIRGSVRAIPRALKIFGRSRRMKERWPFFGYRDYLDTPLAEIRRRFGIELLPRPTH